MVLGIRKQADARPKRRIKTSGRGPPNTKADKERSGKDIKQSL